MQFAGQAKPPAGIVFDSAMSRIDDALALALLYGFDGKNETRVVSISVSRPDLRAAAFCDAVGRFYAGSVSGAFGGFGRTLPIGLAGIGKEADDVPMLSAPLAKREAQGKPVYEHENRGVNDTAEVAALIRNALTAQYDQNAIVILTGPATNLVKVLGLPGVKDLISRKVRFLSVAAGAYPDGRPEVNVRADIPAATRLFAEWPTPIVAAGYELGEALPFPAAGIDKDFAWSTAHPVVDAYRSYRPMPYDAPTWALAAVLYAVRPQEGYFKLSGSGTIEVLGEGRTRFVSSPAGKHQYLVLDPSQKDRIIKTYTEIASAKPVPRQPRFRRKQQEQQQRVDSLPAA
jgi:hypothetical protein